LAEELILAVSILSNNSQQLHLLMVKEPVFDMYWSKRVQLTISMQTICHIVIVHFIPCFSSLTLQYI